MRILSIDIETSPNLAHVWSLWNQNVGLNQLLEPSEMMCFAAKWMGEKDILFYSDRTQASGHAGMIDAAHTLLDESDVVMHYNGKRFDVPHLNREFVEAGLTPPSPFKQIDLYQVVKQRFKLPSNKLDYVARMLGLKGKVKHEGHTLWVKCMAGDPKAWRDMEKYNKQDVLLLEQLYHILRPWVPNHPSFAIFTGTDCCPACGSTRLEKRGFAYTTVSKFQRFRCKRCGKWSRGGKALSRVDIREVTG
jgi:hypothetical protein